MGADYIAYVARGLVSGLFKIGRTRHVPNRMQSLASAHEPVELLATLPGPRELEKRLHKHFEGLRADVGRGREWYRDDGAIAAFVGALPSERRGCVVFANTGRRPYVRHSPEEREATRRAKMLAHARRFESAHGHPYPLRPDTCRRCAVEADRRRIESSQQRSRVIERRADGFLFPLDGLVVSLHAANIARLAPEGQSE